MEWRTSCCFSFWEGLGSRNTAASRRAVDRQGDEMHPKNSIGLWAAVLGAFLLAGACTEEGKAPVPAPAQQVDQSALTARGDDECCTEVGLVYQCWLKDAEADGVVPDAATDCVSGDWQLTTDGLMHLCVCDADAQCGPKGICYFDTPTATTGLCGPSYCNGYQVCNCYAGCIAGDDTTPSDNCDSLFSLDCCEGNYPKYPGESSDVGFGFCSNDPTCGDGCASDSDCLDDLNNTCTTPHCDVATGVCSLLNNSDPCNADSDGCTQNDTCSGGSCGVGTMVTCDDTNLCTDDTCVSTGNNAHTCDNVNNNDPCNADSDGCTVDDVCTGGACVTGAAADCSGYDTNVCTDNFCESMGVTSYDCDYTYNDDACNDSDACTNGDICALGSCAGTEITCADTNLCTDDTCNHTTGCVYTIDTSNPCTDSNACTSDDHCDGTGACVGSAVTCSDGNQCTDDTCDIATGCVFTNDDTNSCDNPDACKINDHCVAGVCVTTSLNCDDGNPCTNDSCNPASGCVHTNNALSCDDASACTSGDVCAAGVCAGTPISYDDSNVCTDDACDPLTGVSHTNNTASCNADGSGCTQNDVCSAGICNPGPAVNCADANVCTDDSCSSTGANTYTCVHANNTAGCDDGQYCTTGDVCAAGVCGGTPRTCGTNTTCTTYSCNESTDACVTTYTTAACDDGQYCTTGDVCASGVCAGAARNCGTDTTCTLYSCNEGSDTCVTTYTTAACNADSDGCTQNDTCSAGTCTAGAAPNCDDSNGCTNDSCSSSGVNLYSCLHANNTLPCNADSDGCTQNDACSAGTCTAGAAPNCSDSNGCTNDSCSSSGVNLYSCLHANNTLPCNLDSDGCTVNDTCSAGACVAGAAPNCNDSNGCTNDGCSSSGASSYSCTHSNNTNVCDDGAPCTLNDVCAAGVCGGTWNSCHETPTDDICTADSCTAGTGACAHAAISGCCLADSDCAGTCGPMAPVTCNHNYCDTDMHQCFCDATYGFDHGANCTLDTNTYPANCWVGDCTNIGSCNPRQYNSSGSDLCRTMFTTGDPTTLDSGKASYLGSFVNTSTTGLLHDGTNSTYTDGRLELSGSTVCANNNYEATGMNCFEEGAAGLSAVKMGASGKDAVFVFEYQTNSASQFQLYAYEVQVQANFNVGVYLKTNIENADQCPEGVSESPTGFYDVPSSRCFAAFSGATAVQEDRCQDGNSAVSQSCCNPLRGGSLSGISLPAGGVTCGGSGAASPKGYYWCIRPYPSGCCGYVGSGTTEYCDGTAADLGTKCQGYWRYPEDPFKCTSNNPLFATSNVATAIVSPKGATDGSKRKVFIFVDGVNYGGQPTEGSFYITVTKKAWTAAPCDRTNDDMRVYDVTNIGYTGSTFRGTLSTAVNSTHNGSGSCGGYNCANSWSGKTGCHGVGSATEFWPNGEFVKIDRPAGTGNQTYCIQSDEGFVSGVAPNSAADLTMDISSIASGAKSICSATWTNITCAHNNSGSNIKYEFTASAGKTYAISFSNYNYLDRPCGAQTTYGCQYSVNVREGPCPPTCAGAPLGEAAQGTITMADAAYGSVTVPGTLTAGDGNNYTSCSGSAGDESWVLRNTTDVAITPTITVQQTGTTWDAINSVYNCSNVNLACQDSAAASSPEVINTVQILPGQDYYIVPDSFGGAYGTYNLTVTWGTPPVTCAAPNLWTVSPAYMGGIKNSGSPVVINAGSIVPASFVGNSCTAVAPDLNGTWSTTESGWDDMWQINVTADRTVNFTGCVENGADGANFDSYFGIYDCSGKLIKSNDDGCEDDGWDPSYDSSLDNVHLSAARSPYYLLVEAYSSGECGAYDVHMN
jgi:hypothetical protein